VLAGRARGAERGSRSQGELEALRAARPPLEEFDGAPRIQSLAGRLSCAGGCNAHRKQVNTNTLFSGSPLPLPLIHSALLLLVLGPTACSDEEPRGADFEDESESYDDESGDELDADEPDDYVPALEEPQIDPDVPEGPAADGLELVATAPEPETITSSALSTLLLGGSYTVTSTHNPVVGGHNGMDFAGMADGAVSVKSPVAGTVIAKTTTCGKVAIFDGSNTIILAHMTQLSGPAINSAIAKGTIVGKASKVVGGGCSATGTHLHIEIRTGQNSSMASPNNNNAATTRNPLTYL